MLGQLRSGYDDFGATDVVVGDENELKQVTHVRVVVHLLPHRADELDDALGHVVTRRSLAADDDDARYHFFALLRRRRLDLIVPVNHREYVEQLTLVLMDALDLNVKQSVRAHHCPRLFLDQLR